MKMIVLNGMKKQSKQRIALSIVVVSLWFIFFSYMCVVMGIAKLFVSPELKDFFIQITSSLGGGFCTLLSVILAARYAKERDNENDIKNNIPDIFLPLNCDYSHVV